MTLSVEVEELLRAWYNLEERHGANMKGWAQKRKPVLIKSCTERILYGLTVKVDANQEEPFAFS